MAVKEKELPRIVHTDSRNKIALGPDAAGYYTVTESDGGYVLSKVVDIVTKRDQDLQQDDEFWQKNFDVLGDGKYESI
jgi:hypothetical protein